MTLQNVLWYWFWLDLAINESSREKETVTALRRPQCATKLRLVVSFKCDFVVSSLNILFRRLSNLLLSIKPLRFSVLLFSPFGITSVCCVSISSVHTNIQSTKKSCSYLKIVGHLRFAVRFRVVSPSIILLFINDWKLKFPNHQRHYHFGVMEFLAIL